MSIRRNKPNLRLRGFSLLEVIIATLLLGLALVPIYRSFSTVAVQEIETNKLSMARKVLESLKNEMTGQKFTVVSQFLPAGSGYPDFVDVGEVGNPMTISELLKHQKKFKDFAMQVFLRYTNANKSVIECKGVVSWSNESSQKRTEELRFLMVKP